MFIVGIYFPCAFQTRIIHHRSMIIRIVTGLMYVKFYDFHDFPDRRSRVKLCYSLLGKAHVGGLGTLNCATVPNFIFKVFNLRLKPFFPGLETDLNLTLQFSQYNKPKKSPVSYTTHIYTGSSWRPSVKGNLA